MIPRILLIGYGSIGQALIPLLRAHIPHGSLLAIAADSEGRATAIEDGVELREIRLHAQNFEQALTPLLGPGDLLINVSVEVSSTALIGLARARGALYLDAGVEPWAGGYEQEGAEPTTNGQLRDQALALGRVGPTAAIAQGANPGLISHLALQGIERLGRLYGLPALPPAQLARLLGVSLIQVAESDTQEALSPEAEDEFACTWSVPGFLSEAGQRAELGLGSHERELPAGSRRSGGGLILATRGLDTKARSWSPTLGMRQAYLITHHEALSLSAALALPGYAPSCYYAYAPCPATERSIARWRAGANLRPKILGPSEIASGADELGALILHDRGSHWFGSRLSADHARSLAPRNSATSLQVAASMIGAIHWMLDNPSRGVIEAEDMDYNRIIETARPYLGDLLGAQAPFHGQSAQLLDFLLPTP